MSLEQHLSNEQLTAIAAEYGTPVYVYNADKITSQYQQLTTAFAGQQVRFLCLQSTHQSAYTAPCAQHGCWY